MNQQGRAGTFCSNSLFCVSALAQCIQPGQGFHRPPAHGGPQRQDDSPPGPEAPLGGQHGSLLLHEEPAPFHLPKPSQESLLSLPEHQVSTVHAFQPLHQIQQVTEGSGAGAARAQPALPAAIHWLSTRLGPARSLSRHLLCSVGVQHPFAAGSSLPSFRCVVSPLPTVWRKRNLVVALVGQPCPCRERSSSRWLRAQSLE